MWTLRFEELTVWVTRTFADIRLKNAKRRSCAVFLLINSKYWIYCYCGILMSINSNMDRGAGTFKHWTREARSSCLTLKQSIGLLISILTHLFTYTHTHTHSQPIKWNYLYISCASVTWVTQWAIQSITSQALKMTLITDESCMDWYWNPMCAHFFCFVLLSGGSRRKIYRTFSRDTYWVSDCC